MTNPITTYSATHIAHAVASGELRALDVCDAALAEIDRLNGRLHAFTDVMHTRARTKARQIDEARARGDTLPPLAGVPFAAKNLFDIAGLATRAGSKINRDRAPSRDDATLIQRLEASGAVLLGALNMGEYAYDFTGENIHEGASLNPHDLAHMSGGSSGGSGTAVGAGLVPIALGSDTNGSIRVPSSFCGLFGLKPTYGRLSRAGTFPFVASIDHLGPLARSTADLAAVYDAMLGADPADAHQSARSAGPLSPILTCGCDGLRIARLGGYFDANASDQARKAVDAVCAALEVTRTVELAEAHRARAAAFVITAAEGGELHLDRLRARAHDFDPPIRDRLIAGTMVPAAWVQRAHKLRTWFRAEARKLFESVDVLIAPATPCVAPRLGETTLMIDGRPQPLRPNIGIFTQPISFIGLPVVAAPVWLAGEPLPIGVQIIAAAWREDLALRVAHQLEKSGVSVARVTAIE